MKRRPFTNLGLDMRTIIVQHNMQDLLTRITAADPLEERQEFYPGLVVSELAVEPVGLQIVDGQEMTHAALATVGGPQALHALTRPRSEERRVGKECRSR